MYPDFGEHYAQINLIKYGDLSAIKEALPLPGRVQYGIACAEGVIACTAAALPETGSRIVIHDFLNSTRRRNSRSGDPEILDKGIFRRDNLSFMNDDF